MSDVYKRLEEATMYAHEKAERLVYVTTDLAAELMAKLILDKGRIAFLEGETKGGCYACEAIGEANIKLEAEIAALKAELARAREALVASWEGSYYVNTDANAHEASAKAKAKYKREIAQEDV